ncbi:MAG: phage integrase N-terminal domain-containing protein [Gammaproteobacteria bacterium]
MRDLNFELKQLCRANRDGSYRTQADRERTLAQIADQLHALGYRNLKVHGLKQKHVQALVRVWRHGDDQHGWRPVSAGTTKNRMSVLRWWAGKIGKPAVIANSNGHYGIAKRQFVTNESKALTLEKEALERIADPHVRLSLELQREFGLRREEAIKFIPRYADRGDTLVLKPSWTKGSKERVIPVRADAQREVLLRAHRLAGRGSLIPNHRSYVQQKQVYEKQTTRAGLSQLHGLRHQYAQSRYRELTGWKSPAAGGPKSAELTADQKLLDREARLTISCELGHEREQITAVYLGR